MKRVTITYKVYKFKELNKEAKERAINTWYESQEDYPYLQETLHDELLVLLQPYKIFALNEKECSTLVHYSLSHCQGDGACFTGKFQWKSWQISIAHYRSYHYLSTDIVISKEDKNGDTVFPMPEVTEKFLKIYKSICVELEKTGYDLVDYRMNDIEFSDHCEANGYNFFVDGKMANL